MMRRPPRSPALPCTTRCRSQRDDDPLAGEPVHGLDAVAGGPHPLHAGAHAVVDCDAAGPAERDPGLAGQAHVRADTEPEDRKSTRLNSSHANISYAVFCLKK